MTWDQACTSFAQRMFDAFGRHGNVAPLLIGHVPMGPHAAASPGVRAGDAARQRIFAAAAARGYATLSRYILGFAMQLAGSAPPNRMRTCPRLFIGSIRSAIPRRSRSQTTFPVPLEDEFAFGLRLLVAGLDRHKT